MLSDRFHPATVIMLWSIAVIALLLKGSQLPWIAVAGLFALLATLAPSRFRSVLRRMRYLLLAVALSFSIITPGQVIPAIPCATYEGVTLALQQLVSLSVMAGMVALLMTVQTMNQLMLGLLVLATPLHWFGMDTRPLAVRLGLTLEAITTSPASGLSDRSIEQANVQNYYRLPSIPWRCADLVAVSCVVLGCGVVSSYGWSLT